MKELNENSLEILSINAMNFMNKFYVRVIESINESNVAAFAEIGKTNKQLSQQLLQAKDIIDQQGLKIRELNSFITANMKPIELQPSDATPTPIEANPVAVSSG